MPIVTVQQGPRDIELKRELVKRVTDAFVDAYRSPPRPSRSGSTRSPPTAGAPRESSPRTSSPDAGARGEHMDHMDHMDRGRCGQIGRAHV